MQTPRSGAESNCDPKRSTKIITLFPINDQRGPKINAGKFRPRTKELEKDLERTTSRLEVKPTSGIPAITRDNRSEQKQGHDTTTYGAKVSRRILTPLQAAELLKNDDKTITRWARLGYIPAHPMGQGKKKCWRFFEDELIAWLMDQKNGAFAA